jgi:uncharacterized protein YndB with AHSA1/START domain
MLILLILAVLLVVLLVSVVLQPADFRIARSTTIAAPSATVFAHVNDFHRWEAWSPWAKLDPAMKTTYKGAPAGTGAIYAWAGNGKVGEGRMTLTESRPPELIRIKLEFFKPFAGTNTAEFTFKAGGGGTGIEWTMRGRRNFIMKAMGLVMNMDKMIGGDFEKGLANLKALAETAAGK